MSSHEIPVNPALRRWRFDVADGASVGASYIQDSPSVLLEILTAQSNSQVPVTAHLLIAIAEAMLELAHEIGPIAEPLPAPPLDLEAPPEAEKPPFALPEGVTYTPPAPESSLETPEPEGTP